MKGWSAREVAERGTALLDDPKLGISEQSAKQWLTMRVHTAKADSEASGTSQQAMWDPLAAVLWTEVGTTAKQMLKEAAPLGLLTRGFSEADSKLLLAVLERNKQPLGANQRLLFRQWAMLLWPWLERATELLRAEEALWRLDKPCVIHPFASREAAKAMLVPALRSGVVGAFVVRFSTTVPLRIAVSYTDDSKGTLKINRFQVVEEGGFFSVPIDGGSICSAPSLSALISKLDVLQYLTMWRHLPGSKDGGMFEYVSKRESMRLLEVAAAAEDEYGVGYGYGAPMQQQ